MRRYCSLTYVNFPSSSMRTMPTGATALSVRNLSSLRRNSASCFARSENSHWRSRSERAEHFLAFSKRPLRFQPLADVLIQNKLAAENAINDERNAVRLDLHG